MVDPQTTAVFTVHVCYFASLRERLGCAEAEVKVAPGATVREVWQAAAADASVSRVLAAVNMEYVDWDHVVSVGDEVAFFPPVTGG